jgi:hypothetical protein
MTVKGHLIRTLQRSTGMRGDDLRSMHLAALQPYNMALPNDFSNREVPALVLLQWNHKTVHTTNVCPVCIIYVCDPLVSDLLRNTVRSIIPSSTR